MEERVRVVSISILFLLALFLISAESASACTCARPPTLADDEFSSSKVVGIFKLKSKKGSNWTFSLQKIYKGDAKVGDELTFYTSLCTAFRESDPVGGEYLLYTGWMSNYDFIPCTRSNSVEAEHVKSDLLWLDKLDQVKGKSRFSGVISQWIDMGPGSPLNRRVTLTNWRVTLKGNGKTYEAVTNTDGIYEIYDLPPGVYEVTPAPINGYDYYRGEDWRYPPGTERTIFGNSHAEENIAFVIDHRAKAGPRGHMSHNRERQ
jgi:hypothetical protein